MHAPTLPPAKQNHYSGPGQLKRAPESVVRIGEILVELACAHIWAESGVLGLKERLLFISQACIEAIGQ
jgi:hypothetical protein